MRIPFIGQSYQDRSLSFDAQRTINLYPIKSEVPDSKNIIGLRGTPGLFIGQNMDLTFSGFNLDEPSPIVPPAPPLIPSGDPVILDFTFPGPAANIPAAAFYTFAQDVKFPKTGTYPALTVMIGSSATGAISGTPANRFASFFLAPDDVLGTEQEGISLIFSDDSSPEFTQIIFSPPPFWFAGHTVGDFIVFSAGEQLFLYPNIGQANNLLANLSDITLHLVGEAV